MDRIEQEFGVLGEWVVQIGGAIVVFVAIGLAIWLGTKWLWWSVRKNGPWD